jgi:predicted dehydrogenase
LRAADIGIGAIARLHARAPADVRSVELVAGCCRTEKKGRAFAAEFGCTWHAYAAKMLRRGKTDFVTAATPSGAHLEAGLTAARRGVHVICEKPLEISRRRIDRMIAAEQRAGFTFGVTFSSGLIPRIDWFMGAAVVFTLVTLVLPIIQAS